jgi:restriction endonuclease Mrr
MSIPPREEFTKPVLKAFADGEAKNQKEVEILVAIYLKLSNEESKQLSLNSSQTAVAERVAWAIFNLYRADLIVKAGNSGFYKITNLGLKSFNTTININMI